jgi:hypothetical protein
MVREKDLVEGSLLLEDTSDELRVFFDKNHNSLKIEIEELLEDDVIGIKCAKNGESVFIKSIIWPDVPIRRKISKADSDIRALFVGSSSENPIRDAGVEKLTSWSSKTNFERFILFWLSNDSSIGEILSRFDEKRVKTTQVGDSSIISIDKLKVMFLTEDHMAQYKKLWKTLQATEIIQNILKRRYLILDGAESRTRILEIVPDIVVFPNDSGATNSNYKGTTLLGIGTFPSDPEFWLMELNTREINKVDLS